MRYRWVVLGVGVAAQAAFAAVSVGLPSIAPALRSHYGLSIAGIGVTLAAIIAGMILTMLGWGVLADRIGERKVMTVGLLGAAGGVLAASRVDGAVALVGALVLAGMFGAAVNAASGRAVAGWFAPAERGLAMGVRQSALPLGGAVAAATLPRVAGSEDAPRALLVLAAVCAAGAVLVGVWMRDPAPEVPDAAAEPAPHPLRDGRTWLLSTVSFTLVLPQVSLLSFVALYLHDERGLTPVAAGAVLAGVQVVGVGSRIAVGVLSDRVGSRLRPLRLVVVALTAALVAVPLLLLGPVPVAAAGLVVASVLSLTWNGLVFLSVAEGAPPHLRGVALGLQNTVVAVAAARAPVGFGLAVSAAGWPAAFGLLLVTPVVALVLLGRLLRPATVPG